MVSERTMIKIRWLALGSALAFFAILDVRQNRGRILLIAAGVLYNLLLTAAKNPAYPDALKGLSTFIDIIGLALLIVFTGGPNSVFILYIAAYLGLTALLHSVSVSMTLAVLASSGLSFYYFSSPSAATQAVVLTRAFVFLTAPLGATLLDFRREEPEVQETETEAPPAAEPAEEPVKKEEPPVIVKPVEKDKPVEANGAATVDKPATADRPPAAQTLAEEIGVTAKPREAAPKPEPEEATVEPEREAPVQETKVLREKISELSTLHEASKALGASLIMEEIVDTVVDISTKGLQADIAGALVFDEKTGLMTVAGLRGFTSEEREVINSTTFTPGEGILGEVFLKKKTLNIVDLREERPGSAPFNGRVRSFLVTPLSTDGFDIGVLFLGKLVKEPFSASSEEFIETISGQAAIAVENARLYSQAQELAIHNGLTGIYNYRYFMRQLDEEIKRSERYGRSVSLMMIDIDLFKNVNDTHGHQRGDEVLKGLSETLVSNTRETDVVARYGGEEFCVILPETDLADALEVAEKLRASVAKASYAREKGLSVRITISIGVAAYPGNAGNQEDLLREADDALYAAKTKRNMVVSAGSGGQTVK
jgi:diguanylate cyclase (GGDEF)-like protein